MSDIAAPTVILPDHPDYDAARAAWNLAADLRPAAVVVAGSADEVRAAVAYAAAHGLKVAPLSSGHLAGALPRLQDALLLKTAIGGVEVDVAARRARIGAGAIWQDVIDAVAPTGLAAPSGSAHDVGVVGYTLGGGVSWLGRKIGLAANHVHAIELVTAAGELVRCDAQTEPELFWALRGGAGNFGVVTAIEIGLIELETVVGGMTIWPADDARAVLEAWVAWCATAPEEATTAFRLLRLPPLPEIPEPLRDVPVVVVDGALMTGDAEAASRLLAPLRSIGSPIMETWGPMPPAGLVEIHMDPPQPVPGIGDGLLLTDLDGPAIDAFLAVVDPAVVRPLLLAELRHLGGALGRAPDGAGARGALEGRFSLFAVGVPTEPEVAEAIAARLGELFTALRPAATGTTYLNLADSGGPADAAFAPADYERLRDARAAWDPGERFLASHRIAPR